MPKSSSPFSCDKMRFLFIFWILVPFLNPISASKNLTCTEQFCLPKDYNRLLKPYSDKPVHISVDLDILQILKVNDLDFTITFSMYFGVYWNEPRLIASQESFENNPYVPIDLSFFEHLWVPDIYIYDLKSIRSYKIFTDFAGLWVVNGSQILYSHESHISFYCPMRFERYPLDVQVRRV